MRKNQLTSDAIDLLLERVLPDGGFANVTGGSFRPDCTAWAVVALKACGGERQLIQPALARLAGWQQPDGRVLLLKAFRQVFWPTALGLMAWHNEPDFENASRLAIEFLLRTKSLTFPYDKNTDMGTDSTLAGWPWVENTYAWVVPTALSMLALKSHGFHHHSRVEEGARLLLDRQLPSGGWNCGDTVEFGTELLPFPDTTGLALAALHGLCPKSRVSDSLRYLDHAVEEIRTPYSLAWALIGLSMWSARPADYRTWLAESLALQARYGKYDTDLLAQLVIAGRPGKELAELFALQKG